MSGQAGSRGYLYQAISAVFESLIDNRWDKIYIEFSSQNDKVDIALEENEEIIRVIQVKSTIGSFRKSDVVKWLNALIDDNEGAKYVQLHLIGACTEGVTDFFESINKYKINKMDSKAETTLLGFDCNKIKTIEVLCKPLPYDIENLKAILRDSLNKYLSINNLTVCFDALDFIVEALVNEQMVSSISGRGIDRSDFETQIRNRIELLSNQNNSGRVSVGIQSFRRGAENLEERVDKYCDLLKYFDGRYLKQEYSWNGDIFVTLSEFINNLDKQKKYKFFLDTHTSIAFSAGRLLDSKSGFDVLPMQKDTERGMVLWNIDKSLSLDCNWDVEYKLIREDVFETVLILNVTKSIYVDVISYIKANNLSIGMIINCTPKDKTATSLCIKNGTHAYYLADSVYKALARRDTPQRRSLLHIFSAAPNGFMFFLGKVSRGFGNCILYEYDFEQRRSCTYDTSISFLG